MRDHSQRPGRLECRIWSGFSRVCRVNRRHAHDARSGRGIFRLPSRVQSSSALKSPAPAAARRRESVATTPPACKKAATSTATGAPGPARTRGEAWLHSSWRFGSPLRTRSAPRYMPSSWARHGRRSGTQSAGCPPLCCSHRSQPGNQVHLAEFLRLRRAGMGYSCELHEGVRWGNLVRVASAIQRISQDWNAPRRQLLLRPRTYQSPNLVPALEQSRNQPLPHVAGPSGDEHAVSLTAH